ncbi:MAG: mechanosensitive ion channel family protein [Aureispira sp.]
MKAIWNSIQAWLEQLANGGTSTQSKVLTTIIIIFVLWLLLRLVLRSIMSLQSDIAVRYTWRKSAAYTTYVIGIIAILFVWSNNFGDFATYLGLLSAGLAIAFQDPIVNMAGWYFILLQKPFRVGDRIEVEGQIGDVVDINLFQFTIVEVGNWVKEEQSTGRIIHIPNAKIFKAPLANYNEGLDYIWNEMKVLVTFESNWRKAKVCLQEILDEHAPKVGESAKKELQDSSGEYLIYYHKVTPIVYTTVEDSGVLLTLRYLCKPKSRRSTTCFLWENILDTFQEEEDLDFAYPTRRAITSGLNPPRSVGDE